MLRVRRPREAEEVASVATIKADVAGLIPMVVRQERVMELSNVKRAPETRFVEVQCHSATGTAVC